MYDFIIVGQGLAGSVLSLSLIKSGYTVCVIDKPGMSYCSQAAAGIWNPVVFKRLTKSWLADDVVPELISFYNYAEKLFGTKLIHERSILKPFTEQQEKNLWVKKAETENGFLDPVLYKDLKLSEQNVIAEYSKVLNAGNIDVKLFLESTKKYLVSLGSYLEERFDHNLLKNTNGVVSYNSISAKQIVFCEGHLISQNPFFKNIPMKPAKGEVLTIYCEGLLLENDILNKGIFVLPLGNNTYKVGATYEWEQLNDLATEKAKDELTKKLDAIITVPYKIIAHEAGIRPAVTDRRPVIGKHSEISNYYVFNGFGTKAVMLAPYFAEKFCQNASRQQKLSIEVDPERF
ncbi:MAG: FAD-binding oxidoreductase [Bacteroidota bacterium]